jgi:hypothetical protein
VTPLVTDVSEVPAAPIFKLQDFILEVSGSCKMLTPVYQTVRCHVPVVRYNLGVAMEMYLNVNGT